MAHERPRWVRWGGALVALALATLGSLQLDGYAEWATVAALVAEARRGIEGSISEMDGAVEGAHRVALAYEGDALAHRHAVEAQLEASRIIEPGSTGHDLTIRLDLGGRRAEIEARLAAAGSAPVIVAMTRPSIASSAVLPALVAIILAFATGRVAVSLGAAVLLGAALSVGSDPRAIVSHAASSYFWEATFQDGFKLWILAFTCGLLGLVGLATRAGGMRGIVEAIARRVKGAQSAQRATAAMGLAVFFDDYANTVLVGSTMRPLSDRMRVAREKLAYLVDSTAAPIAGVAFISTWIGFEIGLLSDAADGVGLGADGYALFLHALPFRFYCLFTLVFVAILVLSGRDFGPMLRAERRAARDGAVVRPGSRPLSDPTAVEERPLGRGGRPPRDARCAPIGAEIAARRREERVAPAMVALLPIGVVLLGTIVGLFIDGGGLASGAAGLISLAAWRDAVGAAGNSTFVMAAATGAGSLLLFVLVLSRRLLTLGAAVRAYLMGAWSMAPAVLILVLAWAIKAVCDDLGTDHLLVAVLGESVPPLVVPLAVFGLAALVAFSTGTSWGTMGILIPVAVPLAFHLGGPALTFVTMAAVLDGAIFGDHCSPISDTTVMSSLSTGCDHMDHVRTQAPYAVTSMSAAALFGYLWTSVGLPWWLGLLLGTLTLLALVRLLGRDARSDRDATATAPVEPEGVERGDSRASPPDQAVRRAP